MFDKLHGLIIAGGSGTRLWPISRASQPKQLLSLSGGKHSLLQGTFERLARTVDPDRICTVTSAAYDAQVFEQIRALAPGYPHSNLLVESIGRDSAAAVLWGALHLRHKTPDGVVAVLWSDQMIGNERVFDDALRRAYDSVHEGGLAAIGVHPIRPATNLGYIRYGRELSTGVYEVERFIEKPDQLTAEHLLAEGGCVWNAGIFVFHLNTLIEEFERLAPRMIAYFREHDETLRQQTWSDPELMRSIYLGLRKESVDNLLLEQTDRLVLIPADLEWSDLGAWDELYFQSEKDENGNALTGNTVTVNTQNSFIQGGKRLIATVGVEDLVVVDTNDALLICNMKRVQDIKGLVEALRESDRPEAVAFEQTERPWGSYSVLHDDTGCKVKVLDIKPGHKLSLQLHNHRDEHWVVVEGEALLTCGEETHRYAPNEYLHIPRATPHRIENPGAGALRIIEVQHGDYLEEDDIVRLEDDYGRA